MCKGTILKKLSEGGNPAILKSFLVFRDFDLQKTKGIVSDDLNFPTDLYVLQVVVDQMGEGYELLLAQSKDGLMVSMEELEKAVDENTALVVLSHVAFESASMYSMKAITDA